MTLNEAYLYLIKYHLSKKSHLRIFYTKIYYFSIFYYQEISFSIPYFVEYSEHTSIVRTFILHDYFVYE